MLWPSGRSISGYCAALLVFAQSACSSAEESVGPWDHLTDAYAEGADSWAVHACEQQNAECGSVPDGYGGVANCGSCPANLICGGGGPNRCGVTPCQPLACSSLGNACGVIPDGCKSTLFCSTCAPDKLCVTQQCQAIPAPSPRAPCDKGDCWVNAPQLTGACGTQNTPENFKTGKYNVHRYALPVSPGVAFDLTLTDTGGTWNPALLVLTTDGLTLYDGDRGVAGGDVKIVRLASGRKAESASLRILSRINTSLHVYVTSWAVVDGDFASAMPTSVVYAFKVQADCLPTEAVCPLDRASILELGSGYFVGSSSTDPSSPDYTPYKRDDRAEHAGYDLFVLGDTPVVATQSGTVSAVSEAENEDCGKRIDLKVGEIVFRYCHLSKISRQPGDGVKAGEDLGLTGITGKVLGPQLEFLYLTASEQPNEAVNRYVDSLCR